MLKEMKFKNFKKFMDEIMKEIPENQLIAYENLKAIMFYKKHPVKAYKIYKEELNKER